MLDKGRTRTQTAMDLDDSVEEDNALDDSVEEDNALNLAKLAAARDNMRRWKLGFGDRCCFVGSS